MKNWDKVVHNKIIAKAALAAVSIAVLATVIGETPTEAYAGNSVIQEQDGIVLIWEWHKLGNRAAIKEFMTEAYYNPTPLMLVPYDINKEDIVGQPISLYADSQHVLADPNRSRTTPEIGAFENSVREELYSSIDYDIAGELPAKENLASHFMLRGNKLTLGKTTLYYTDGYDVDNRSMIFRSDYDNDVISDEDLHSDVFYTGGNARGSLWFASSTSFSNNSDYLYGGGPTMGGWITVNEPECKTSPSAIIGNEAIIQNVRYETDKQALNQFKEYLYDTMYTEEALVPKIPKTQIVKSYELSPDYHFLTLDDTGTKGASGLYYTYAGLSKGSEIWPAALMTGVHFVDEEPSPSGFMPVTLFGRNWGKHYSDSTGDSISLFVSSADVTVSGAPCGATVLAYDSGLLYGLNRFYGRYTYSVEARAKFLGMTVYSDTDHYETFIDTRSSFAPVASNAKARNGFFTTMYGAFYGKEYIFSAFKGETNEAGLDGRPTTVISGIRTVGGNTYVDENGGVIETEGEILCEGNTLVVPEGAVLAVDGNFVNNGRIEINGGTLIVKEGGTISQIGNTAEGSIVCNQGDSGEAGQIIVMPGAKILCTAYINSNNVADYTNRAIKASGNSGYTNTMQPGLIMNAGSSLVNYGTVCCSSMVIDSKATIECRSGSEMKTGYCNKDEIFFFAKAENYMDGLETISADYAKKLEIALNVKLSMAIATGTDEEIAAIRAAYGIMRDYINNAATIITRGEGDAIIIKEPNAGNIEGFGDKVIIKTTEY